MVSRTGHSAANLLKIKAGFSIEYGAENESTFTVSLRRKLGEYLFIPAVEAEALRDGLLMRSEKFIWCDWVDNRVRRLASHMQE